MSPSLIICMGVSGVGKSTCARILATEFNLVFIEADDLHSSANKQKMRSGEALNDSDRAPWMQAVCERLSFHAAQAQGCVLAHSGLRRPHREQLRNCGMRSLFLHLDAPRDTIAQRIVERESHYMKVDLLDSQFRALEKTHKERDVVTLNAKLSRSSLMTQAILEVEKFINHK